MSRPRVFIDMDGVIVDFDKALAASNLDAHTFTRTPGVYRQMDPIDGAIEAVRAIAEMGYEVWLATKPPTGCAHAYAAKAEWVFTYLPELKRRLIITPDKGLLGCSRDYLIDDRPHAANCQYFQGTLIIFKQGDWPSVLRRLAKDAPLLREAK